MIQTFQNLQFPIFIFFILKYFLNRYNFQSFSISCFIYYSKCSTSHFILTHISSCSNNFCNLFALFSIFFFFSNLRWYSQRILFLVWSKYFPNSLTMSSAELIIYMSFSVQFSGSWLFESNWLDRSLFIESNSITLVHCHSIVSKWSFRFVEIEAEFFWILVGFSLNSTARYSFFFIGSNFKFQVSYHFSTIEYYN